MSLGKMLRPADIKGDTTYDIILRAWLGHKVAELPQELQDMVERWKMADRLIREGTIVYTDGARKTTRYTYAKLVEYLREKFKVNERQLSARQAYEDIRNAKLFFLSCEGREDIEYARGVAIDTGDMMMYAAFDKGDFISAAAFFKELNKIKGLHEQRSDVPDYAEFIPPMLTLVTDATELGFEKIENPDEVVKRILAARRKEFINDEATDAEVLPDE